MWQFVVLEALSGACVGLALSDTLKRNRPVISVFVLAALLLNVVALIWAVNPGEDAYLVAATPNSSPISHLSNPNQAQSGDFAIGTLTYGNGTDRQRPEYREDVSLTTSTVDAAALLPDWSKPFGDMRSAFWGFDAHALPFNGRV